MQWNVEYVYVIFNDCYHRYRYNFAIFKGNKFVLISGSYYKQEKKPLYENFKLGLLILGSVKGVNRSLITFTHKCMFVCSYYCIYFQTAHGCTVDNFHTMENFDKIRVSRTVLYTCFGDLFPPPPIFKGWFELRFW